MKKKIRRFESMLWLIIKVIVYISIMAIFMFFLARENHSLRALSRTLGITLSTFAVVGLLFLNVYGKYDVGRRKSKPIIYSLVLATLFTDLITYVQLMIMRTTRPSIYAFRLDNISALIMAYIVQVIAITIFAYSGNALFFKMHKPERSCIITASQSSLDKIVCVIDKFQKQYSIDLILDYREKNLIYKLKDIDTVFLYDVPVEIRSKVISYCYKKRINIYFNPEVEDVVEMNSQYYVLDDLSLLNSNVKSLTMEQRILKRLMDIILSIVFGILSAPLWIAGAIVVKAYDGGPILLNKKELQ